MNINSAHWHLLLNHFPIILSVIGTGFIVASFIFKKQHLKFASLLLIILAAAFTIPAFATGEPAEEQVEEISGVTHDAIHEHEEIAEKGRIVIFITGGLAFITLLLLHFKKKSVQLFMILTLLASAGSAGILSYVGYTGGEIRHSEIRGDFNFGKKDKPAKETNIPVVEDDD